MSGMTQIMIVEDNPRARQALKALMSMQTGIKVTGDASNGLKAINAIEQQHPDLILMDMRMPVMDGLEATKIIKANWPQIKVVVMTMYPACRLDAFGAGADAFLIKGCPLEELSSIVTGTINTTHKDDKKPFNE